MTRTKFFEKVDFEDENESVRKNCWHCGERHTILVKVITVENGYGTTYPVKTKNHIGICTNQACWRYQRPDAVPSWVREDVHLLNEQPRGKVIAMRQTV